MTPKSIALTEHQKAKGYKISESGKLILPHKVGTEGLNERVAKENLMSKSRERHERRHEHGKRTTKSEALQHFNLMSKDYGKIKQ